MYNGFAKYYDTLITELSYRDRAIYFKKIIDKYLPDTKLVLDMGCGTGSLCVELANFGYDVTGVDISMSMLSEAMNKLSDCEHSILYLCQDMRQLDLYGTMDTVISALDCINHITSEEELAMVFARLQNFVTDDGLFIFDVNTPYKHSHILANETFVYDMDDVYCVWQNTLEEDNATVNISLDFFEYEDGAYYRSNETFKEKAYPISTIEKLLNNNHFTLEAVYDEDSFNTPTSTSQRWVVVARRNKRV